MRLGKERSIIANFIWCLKQLHKFKKKFIGVFLIESIIRGILPVVSLVMIQQIIDMLQYKTDEIDQIIIRLLLFSVFQLLCEVSLNYTQLALKNWELEFDSYFQASILKKISVLDSKDFENTETYNLINRTQYDGNAGIMGTIKTIFSLISMVISIVSYAAIMLKYNILIFVLIILMPIIRYYFEKKYNLAEYELDKKNTELIRRTAYISFLLTNSENFKEIKSYNLFGFFVQQYEKYKDEYNHDFINLHNRITRIFSIIGILNSLVDFLVISVILIQTFLGILSIGDFILYNNSVDNLKENTLSMLSLISYIYKNSAMIEQMRKFFDIVPENVHKGGVKVEEIQKITLKNISYRYQGKSEYALKNINLEFVKDDFIVLVGYNGSGKSTLIKIIMGIYSDYEGDIFVNDINLKDVDLEKYRERISVMFQNYIKYESSILDNIKYGCMEASRNSEIGNILDKVALTNFKEYMGQPLGYQFTEGTQISVGQWQKLALGRTLIKPADIYIFDEPNASLDVVSEQSVLNTIYNERQDKMTILIVHRFNCMLEKANKIIVLEKGKIKEVGVHKELLNNKSLYYHLYTIQKEMAIPNEL